MKKKLFPFFRLTQYLKPYRMRMSLAVICASLNKIFDILPEALIGIAVDVVVNKQQSYIARLGFQDLTMQLYILGGLTFVIWACESLFEYFSEVLWRNLAQTVQHKLRVSAYGHMQKLEMAYFEDKSTGELLSILNDDINQLERFLDHGIAEFIHLVVGTTCIGFIFFYLAPEVAFFALLPVPVVLFITYWFQRRLGPLYQRVREKAGLLGRRIANNITGIATIKSYTTEEYELAHLQEDSKAYKDVNAFSIQVSSTFIPVVRMAVVMGFITTIVLGGWAAVQGTLAVSAYSVLLFMTQRLLWPFTNLAKMTDLYARAMASAQRVFAILDSQVGITSGKQHLEVNEVKGSIEFNDISFVYPNGKRIFDHLSLSIKPGQTVAFVGTTGSGKSTIIKLLLRFYDPVSGSIILDGIDLKELKLKNLRQAIGLVSQDVFLFHGTVYGNIAYGCIDATMEQVEQAAKIAEAHEFILSLPQGYQTVVGERGQKLSGGQRQRISIARAVLNNPPIFIFDEATSSVDNETEAAIQRSLEKISADHTTIVIAHRLSTVRNADTIFVLEKGVIVESGTHDALVAKHGVYADLWRVQTGVHN